MALKDNDVMRNDREIKFVGLPLATGLLKISKISLARIGMAIAFSEKNHRRKCDDFRLSSFNVHDHVTPADSSWFISRLVLKH